MDSFSISQLSQYSGIKAHTIRIWEQRYNALQPARSEGNTRNYNGDQLRRLLNIVSLMDTEHKVSELCAMPDAELSNLVLHRRSVTVNETHEYFISQLVSAGMSYDGGLFEEVFEECLSQYGMSRAYRLIIYPLLVRVGLLWSADAIPSVQEHFISNLVRQKLLRSIDSLPAVSSQSITWLLFLPEDDYHEIGLLFASYIIRESGHKVVYLGSSVSTEAILSAITDISPEYLLLFLVRHGIPDHIQQYLGYLDSGFTGHKIYVAGNHKSLSQLVYNSKIQWLEDMDSLTREIKEMSNN